MSFEFSFASQLKTFGAGRWSLFKKKKIPSKTQSFRGENAAAFPSKFCIFKGRFVLQEAAFGSHLRRRSSFFFASLISPFVLSGSSDESHGTCRRAILNPQFLCQMYTRLKPDKGVGGHCHSPCCPWASLDDPQLWALPGAKLFFFFFSHRFQTSGGEMRLPNMSLLPSTRFLLESVMELHFFTSPFKILCTL